MSTPREWQLDTHQLGRRVLVYDTTDSTSTRCAEFVADPRHHGLAVLAHAQTIGRGQHGRRWLCEADTGVLLSVLLFPPRSLNRPAILTAWAAVSVCELIRDITGLAATLKWPNDVLIEGRKVCGILIEQNRGAVVGIGLNLNQSGESFLAAGLTEAGSLRVFTGTTYDVEEMARRLLDRLDQEYQRLLEGEVGGLEDRWRDRLDLRGRQVEIEGHETLLTGQLQELTFAAVTLTMATGETRVLVPEQIKHVTALRS
jgi:BirA family biotin operon repressor/biotin-[acetyl-CoA-carboxylase] ligase